MNNFKTETVSFFKFKNRKISSRNLRHQVIKILKIDMGLVTIEISKTS